METFSCPEIPVGAGGGLRPFWLCVVLAGRPPFGLCVLIGVAVTGWWESHRILGACLHTLLRHPDVCYIFAGGVVPPPNPPWKGAGLR